MICVSHKSSTINYDIKEFRVLIKKHVQHQLCDRFVKNNTSK